MSTRHPPRLSASLYRGIQRYFLTICCIERQRLFMDALARDLVIRELRRTSKTHRLAVLAYCLMPAHLHFVAEAEADGADLLAFVHRFKQATGYQWKRQHRRQLWQPSFYDHVLRDSEDTRAVVRYVLENPVRAGMVTVPADYPHCGSFVYDRTALMEWAFGWQRADT